MLLHGQCGHLVAGLPCWAADAAAVMLWHLGACAPQTCSSCIGGVASVHVGAAAAVAAGSGAKARASLLSVHDILDERRPASFPVVSLCVSRSWPPKLTESCTPAHPCACLQPLTFIHMRALQVLQALLLPVRFRSAALHQAACCTVHTHSSLRPLATSHLPTCMPLCLCCRYSKRCCFLSGSAWQRCTKRSAAGSAAGWCGPWLVQ